MNTYTLTHVSDEALIRNLADLIRRDRVTTAALLAHIAEVDARRIYLAKGFPSMHQYCVQELRLSEDAAAKRIHAARKAREFPVLFGAVAEGRLHLGAVCMLAPHLSTGTVDELVRLATHKTKTEIEVLLARRFPQSEAFTWVGAAGRPAPEAGASADAACQHAPGHAGMTTPEHGEPNPPAPGPVGSTPGSLKPLAPERFVLQASIGQGTYDKIQRAQALLGHRVSSGAIVEVLDRALDALIDKLEKRKFAATERPRAGGNRSRSNPRYVPAAVKRAVWKRDGGQCTFVGENGRRCDARKSLEYDHVLEVARGGESTAENVRLRCRGHNQLTAEQTFGATFMRVKRERARSVAADTRALRQREAEARTAAREAEAKARAVTREVDGKSRAEAAALEQDPEHSVIPWLRRLGFPLDEARRAAAGCEHLAAAPMEQRVRAALTYGRPVPGHGCVREGDVKCGVLEPHSGLRLHVPGLFCNPPDGSEPTFRLTSPPHRRTLLATSSGCPQGVG
jgi:hypothetical protein